ncbi:MAG: DUF1295 domain-containing protein [Gammaproteobacteria bacterium]|nr:DUF1295 domain-containing protein [Gammaproteobacteria bacterium]MDH5800901.1 DUF1295 domain-containing protein [Gammaproteobacteria bacterium]
MKPLKKSLTLLYGVFAYLAFLLVFTYAILFIGNLWVTPSLDTVAQTDTIHALLVDLGLLGAFALQHSIMARPGFKRLWTKIVPEPMERSTYVLASTVLLAAIVYFWEPLGGAIWHVTHPVAVTAIYAAFTMGWAILFAATIQINHFDLFGLRQVWLNFRNQPYTQVKFKTPFLYRHMRHPLYVGMMIGMWATPTMTIAHLVFAIMCTAYIFIGVRLEENDLKKVLPEYEQYKKDVPMFLPSLSSR